jgi:hypothetical protein
MSIKKQGKIVSVPVINITDEMQVTRSNNVGVVVGEPYYNDFTKEMLVNVKWNIGTLSPVNDVKLLKTIVVQFWKEDYPTPRLILEQLPLKYSQWQSVLDEEGLLNSDKFVEFDVIYTTFGSNKKELEENIIQYANIFLQPNN